MPVRPAGRLDRVNPAVELQIPANVPEGVDRGRPVLAGEVEYLRTPRDLAPRGRPVDLVGLPVSGVEREHVRRVERQDWSRLVPSEPEIEHPRRAEPADERLDIHLLRGLRAGVRRECRGGRRGDPAEEYPARDISAPGAIWFSAGTSRAVLGLLLMSFLLGDQNPRPPNSRTTHHQAEDEEPHGGGHERAPVAQGDRALLLRLRPRPPLRQERLGRRGDKAEQRRRDSELVDALARDLRLVRGQRQEGDERAVREVLLDLGQAVSGRPLDDPAGDAVAEPLVDQRAERQGVGLLGAGGASDGPVAAGTGAAPAPLPECGVRLGATRAPHVMQKTLWSGTAVRHFGHVTAGLPSR